MMLLRTLALGSLVLVGSANAQMMVPSDSMPPSDVPSVAPSVTNMPSDMPSSGGSNATTTDELLPSDMPTDMPSGGMTVPADECSVCIPSMILSMPDAIVDLPEGTPTPGNITQASCVLIDRFVMGNAEMFPGEVCQQLRDLFREPCGCIFPNETAVPAAAPTEPSDSAPSDGGSSSSSSTSVCTICPAGQAITMPEEVIALPDEISIVANVPFATCSLLESALASNADAIDEATCATVQTFYAEPCGCMPVDNVPNFTGDDPTGEEDDLDTTSMARWKHAKAMATSAAIISLGWIII